MSKGLKKPPITLQVQEALAWADDLLSLEDVILLTGCTVNQVCAALCHLHKYRVVDSIDQEGKSYYYLTGEDCRFRHLELRTPEDRPRKQRRSCVRHQITLAGN